MSRNDYGVTFNGRRIVHPGAYDYIDASAMVVPTPGSANLPVVVGTSDAGEPGVLKWFSDPSSSLSYLRGGDLSNAVNLMFSPTPEGGGGASVVGVLPANSLARATATVGGLTITSKEYGDGGNRVICSLADGTISGTKKFTAARWDLEKMEVFDNLGAVIKLTYTGEEAYAAVDVTVTGGKATQIQTKVGADQASAAVDVTLDLTTGQYSTVEDIIKYFASISDYQADYVSYWNYNLEVSKLDAMAAASIKSENHIKALKADIDLQIANYSTLVSVESGAGALTNFSSSTLAGGAKGSNPASWADKFDKLKNAFSNILVVLSASPTIHAEALAHVGVMEGRQQRQVLFTGGDKGETTDQVKQRAAMLNSSRAVLCYPGIYHKSISSGKVPLAPYFTAAMVAGRVCGVDPSEPITFDYFNLVALERDLLAGDPEIDDLITSGVCTLERVDSGGIRLVQGITTYLGSNNTLYREISVRRGADALADTMRKTMEDTYVGKRGLKATISSVTTKAIEVLEQAIKDGSIVAYKDIVVRFVNTVVYVDYKVAPTEPINFVLLTSHFIPESQL